MAKAIQTPTNWDAVALFPLPNVVLFPRAVLPLHIFEDRYKQMTADVLPGNRLIAMALLKEGWEKDYHSRPDIDPIVCVGTILTHEQLPDGTYNFLLQGHTRARMLREHKNHEKPYRIAQLQPIDEIQVHDNDLSDHRQRLITIFDSGSLLATVIGRQFRQLLASPLTTAEIADLIAFNFLDDVSLKQSLLSDGDVLRRVTRTVAAFEAARPPITPPSFSVEKPSLN